MQLTLEKIQLTGSNVHFPEERLLRKTAAVSTNSVFDVLRGWLTGSKR